jgi:hypothetical protein
MYNQESRRSTMEERNLPCGDKSAGGICRQVTWEGDQQVSREEGFWGTRPMRDLFDLWATACQGEVTALHPGTTRWIDYLTAKISLINPNVS